MKRQKTPDYPDQATDEFVSISDKYRTKYDSRLQKPVVCAIKKEPILAGSLVLGFDINETSFVVKSELNEIKRELHSSRLKCHSLDQEVSKHE